LKASLPIPDEVTLRFKQTTTMKSLVFSTLLVTSVSLVSAVCPIDQVRVTLLGGVSNQEFCQVSGSCGMLELRKHLCQTNGV
jgi:hypothetical protein